METVEGFGRLVHSIGVSVETDRPEETAEFVFQMYGKKDIYRSGTTLRLPINADGRERILKLDECEWSSDDDIPGQLRFEFPCADELAVASVRLYLKDGFDAPEPEEENPVDLILLDIQMPEMDGYEATRRIRSCSHRDARIVPIIAMTANAFADDVQKCLDAGMNAHIAKPLDLSVLARTLKHWLT